MIAAGGRPVSRCCDGAARAAHRAADDDGDAGERFGELHGGLMRSRAGP
jgi:hypothetical protein